MLVACDGDPKQILKANPRLDRTASLALAQAMFPDESLTEAGDGKLCYTNPPDDEIFVGVFPGVSIIAAGEFDIDFPSQLPERFLRTLRFRKVYLHAMHSAIDWFAFAIWQDGELIRALSLSPDSGILEDLGTKLDFEAPFWNGEHPVDEDEDDLDDDERYPFVFHPLELGEAVLGNLFGYVLEGEQRLALYDAEDVPLMRFERKKVA